MLLVAFIRPEYQYHDPPAAASTRTMTTIRSFFVFGRTPESRRWPWLTPSGKDCSYTGRQSGWHAPYPGESARPSLPANLSPLPDISVELAPARFVRALTPG